MSPCLQNRPRLSETVADLGAAVTGASAGIGCCRILLWSVLVVSVRERRKAKKATSCLA